MTERPRKRIHRMVKLRTKGDVSKERGKIIDTLVEHHSKTEKLKFRRANLSFLIGHQFEKGNA